MSTASVFAKHADDITTTAPLAASAIYTSSTVDQGASANSWSTRTRIVVTHQAGLVPGHVVFEQSPDGTNFAETHRSPVPSDGKPRGFDFTLHERYYRYKFVNGSTPQTTFNLHGYRVANEGSAIEARQNLQFQLTATSLGASASFISAVLDLGSAHAWTMIRTSARADQSGNFYVQQSDDGVVFPSFRSADSGSGASVTSTANGVAADANNASYSEHKIMRRYLRIVYANGGTAQGVFDLACALIG